jgi:hypothetical protein
MFLERVVVENVRCIERAEMDFTGPDGGEARAWTILLGQNGIGKSSLLRSIALVLCGSEAMSDLLGADPDVWIRQGQDAALIRAHLRTAEGEARTAELRLTRGKSVTDALVANREGMAELDRAFANRGQVRNYLTIGYGASRRLSGAMFTTDVEGASPFRNPRARNVASLFSADAALASVASWAMTLDYREGKKGRQQISRIFDDVTPGVSFESIDKERGDLVFKTPDGLIPLRQLSDGYQQMIGWCGDLLYRVSRTIDVTDFAKPMNLRGLLIVDEIDLHLHPVWQRRLRDFLTRKFPQFQILGTTHSPLTAHQAGEEELFVLRRPAPDAPPKLDHIEAAPNQMLIQHLLVSPIFEIDTAVSLTVERKQTEYKRAKAAASSEGKAPARKKAARRGVAARKKGNGGGGGGSSRSAARTRVAKLKKELASVPAWAADTPLEKRQLDVLRNLQSALGIASTQDGQ